MRFVIFFSLFLSFTFASFADETELVEYETYPVMSEGDNFCLNCGKGYAGDSKIYLSSQSQIKNPTYQITVKIPDSTGSKSVTAVFNFDFSDQEANGCLSIKCFENFDIFTHIKEQISKKDDLYKKLTSKFPSLEEDFDLTNLKISKTIINAKLDPYTPVFESPPISSGGSDSLSNEELEEKVLVILRQESKEQAKETGEEPEDDDVLRTEIWHIASFYEEPLLENDEEDNSEVIIDKNDQIASLSIDTAKILAESGNPELAQKIIDSLLLAKKKSNKLATPPLDQHDREDENLKFEKPIKTIKIKTAKKSYQIEILSKSEVTTKFRISDGIKSQVFESDFLELMLQPDDVPSNISFKNNSISFKSPGNPVEMDIEAIAISQEKKLAVKDETNLDFEKCLSSINDSITDDNIDDDQIKSFLKLQGELTLHRLAWASLNQENPKEKIEDKILKLIKEKYQGANADVAKNFDTTNHKSRNFLAKSLPLVQDILNQQLDQNKVMDRPFYIGMSDLKMLEILASFEERKPIKNSEKLEFDHRQFKTKDISNSVVNFATLINSAYQQSDYKLSTEESIQKNKDFLAKALPKMQSKLEDNLKSIIIKACIEENGLTCDKVQEKFNSIWEEDINTLQSTIMASVLTRKDEDMIEDLRYEKLWLRVAK